MFLRSSSRPQPVDCFFCLSPSLLPPLNTTVDRKAKGRLGEVGTKWNWNCERCGCWNIRDERGEMVSDLPAMKTPAMNQNSFELRAKPSSSHLPSSTAASPFCHICLTNQTLIMNMLANYLPDESDPTYPSLYNDLSSYLAGVHARYPPVCVNCQPAVDEALRKANHRANVDAWGSALRRCEVPVEDSGISEILDITFWRLRGALFVTSIGLSLRVGVSGFLRPELLDNLAVERVLGIKMTTWLVVYHGLSVFWMAWDPYWLRRRKRVRARVTGRKAWLVDMAVIYFARLMVSVWLWWTATGFERPVPKAVIQGVRAALLLEVAVFVHALVSLKISAPVQTRPIQPVTLSRAPSPNRNPQKTVGNTNHLQPSRHEANPIFGQPAFTHNDQYAYEPEPMDWEPSPTADRFSSRRPPGLDLENDETRDDWDQFAVGPQRMFAARDGHDETGLESLIAGWGIDAGPTSTSSGVAHLQSRPIRLATNSNSAKLAPASMPIGELIVRIASSLLTFARIISLVLVLCSFINTSSAFTIDKILSGMEVGTLVMSAILLPKTYQGPRVAILAGDLILHLVYAVFQRQAGVLGDLPRDPWMLGMTWGQWALLNATRAMV